MGESPDAVIGYGCVINEDAFYQDDDLGMYESELLEDWVSKLPNAASFEVRPVGYNGGDPDDTTTVLFVVDTVTTAGGCGARLIPRPETAHGSRELLEAALAAMGITDHGQIGWILGASYG